MSWNNDVPLKSPCVAPVRELRSHQGLNGRSLRKALRTFCGRHIQCYLDIFLLLGLGSFTWRSLDGIWWQTDRNVNDGLKEESHEEGKKVEILTVPDILSSSLMASWIAASKWLFSFPGLLDTFYITSSHTGIQQVCSFKTFSCCSERDTLFQDIILTTRCQCYTRQTPTIITKLIIH